MMMHLEIGWALTDREYVISSKHKLIQSVIAAILPLKSRKNCMANELQHYLAPSPLQLHVLNKIHPQLSLERH
jgi:hypothetical protein